MAPVLNEVCDALEEQGVEVEMMHAESGGGQFEIVWQYDDLVKAMDKHMVCKETVMAVFRKNGMKATFVPKLSPSTAGSGAHIHLSLWKGEQSLMEDILEADSECCKFFAGIFEKLPSLMAVGLSNANSYARGNIYIFT
jgi:glutamine synthetase